LPLGVAEDVLANAVLLRAGACGSDALFEVPIGLIEDLDQERHPWADRVPPGVPATLGFVEALVVSVLRLLADVPTYVVNG
jgi:hypothetical protein